VNGKGEASTLVQEMRLRDLIWYYNYTRMTPDIFDQLLSLVGPIIQKQETTNFACNSITNNIKVC